MALQNKYADKVNFIIVDVDKEEGQVLAARYKVNSIPAYFFMGNNGVIYDQQVGEATQAEMAQKIEKLLKK